MIKYLGSKRTLIPAILDAVRPFGENLTVLDLFSGTSRVGHALKRSGCRVIANDHNAYAATLARCYVQADAEDVLHDAGLLVREFNALRGERGYFTETYCERSRFFMPANGRRIDAIRRAIAHKCLGPELEAVMLVSLMEAADRVDSTTGLQMAYLKNWAPRAHKPLELRVPDVLPRAAGGKGAAHQLEAYQAAAMFEADVAYVDPPYNQHAYLGNYHVWESLVLWDKPEVYGVACKRADVRTRKSPFNLRREAGDAMSAVLDAIRAPVIIMSFSNEGFFTRDEIQSLLAGTAHPRARVTTIEHDARRYVGAQIGIHNPKGEKVGRVSHLRNTEYLFVAERPRASTPRRELMTPGASAGRP